MLLLLPLLLLPSASALLPCQVRQGPVAAVAADNNALCFALCVRRGGCWLTLFKARRDFERDDGDGGANGGFDENCVLFPRGEGNVLSERMEGAAAAGFRPCKRVRDTSGADQTGTVDYCVSPGAFNVTEAARAAGFNVEVELAAPNQTLTRFYKHVAGDTPFDEMDELCAAEGGVLPQPYDQAALQVLIADGGAELPLRVGLHVYNSPTTLGSFRMAEWSLPAATDWSSAGPLDGATVNECPKFSAWGAADWALTDTYYGADSELRAGSFAGPVGQVTCEFAGPNAALGKPVTGYYDHDEHGARALVTDGDWNAAGDPQRYYRGVAAGAAGAAYAWVAVDLQEPHLVHSIAVKAGGDGGGDLFLYVATELPSAPLEPISLPYIKTTPAVRCGKFYGFREEVRTVLCDGVVGRFALVFPSKHAPFAEVAVFGVPLAQF